MARTYTRRNNRLAGYDYTNEGLYYVTICTYDRIEYFGAIADDHMQLSDAGVTVDSAVKLLTKYYPRTIVDEYIVMPNHVHMIIQITNYVGAAPCGRPGLLPIRNKIIENGQARGPVPTYMSLSDIIHRFKSLTTRNYINGVKTNNWTPFNRHLWQRSFHDHIIRNETSLRNIREYIRNNLATWDRDAENPNRVDNIKIEPITV